MTTAWPVTPLPGSPEARPALIRVALEGLADVSNAQDLLSTPPPPTRYVVPGLLPHGLALLYGKPKGGKSWLALELALAVASGGLFIGHFTVQQGDVLYLALEDGPSRLYERSSALLGDEDGPLGLTFVTRLKVGVDTAIRAWAEAAANPTLVIVDTLQKARGNKNSTGNAYADDYAVVGALKDVADTLGLCLLLVHHARKGSSDDGDVEAASGTFGIAGAADTGWHLRQAVEGISALGMWSRDAEGNEWGLRRVGPTWQVTDGPVPDANLGDRTNAVVALVAQHPQDGVRAAQVATALGISEHQARTYLTRAASKDRITKRTRGLYVPVASVASVADSTGPLLSLATHATDATPPVEIQRPPEQTGAAGASGAVQHTLDGLP